MAGTRQSGRRGAAPPTRAMAPPRRGGMPGLSAVAALLLAVVLYGGTLNHPWISDDREIVADNRTLVDARPGTLLRALRAPWWSEVLSDGRVVPTSDDRNLYRPVATASFWFNARVGGVQPPAFRVVNLLLLAAAAWLLGRLAGRLAGASAALPVTLLVAVHPLGTDVVNRIIGRCELLVVVGVAGFLLLQLGARRGGWSPARVLLAAAAGLVAVGAKESGLMIVPLAFLVCLVPGDASTTAAAPPGGAPRGAGARPGARFFGAGLAAVCAALWLVARAGVTGVPRYANACRSDLLGNPLAGLGLLERLPGALAVAFHDARLLVVPYPLTALDRPLQPPGWSAPEAWGGIAVLITLTFLLLRTRFRPGPAALAAGWWLFAYSLVGQLLFPIGTYREVRLVYPFLGALALGAGAIWIRFGTGRVPARVAGGVLLLLAAAWTLARNDAYRSERRLFEADLPHHAEQASLSAILSGIALGEGDPPRAIRHARRAVELAPRSSQAWTDLGTALIEAGQFAEGDRAVAQALALCGDNNVAWMTAGVSRFRQGDAAAARTQLLEAERRDAGHLPTLLNLCLVEEELGLLDDARKRLRDIELRSTGHPAIAVLSRPFRR